MIEFSFILVEPGEAGNIGAVARAMNTMGYGDLRLIRPKADHLSDVSRALAHRSQHVLMAASVYETLADALSDVDLACACTARHRIEKYHYVSARDLPTVLSKKGNILQRVAIVFGSERSGLSNQDIDQCDLLTTIPQVSLQPSLNLSQAVMIYCFILSQQQTQVHTKDQRLNTQEISVQQYRRLKENVRQLMAKVGLNQRYQNYVAKALARLEYEDLYLVQNIRTFVENKLNQSERN